MSLAWVDSRTPPPPSTIHQKKSKGRKRASNITFFKVTLPTERNEAFFYIHGVMRHFSVKKCVGFFFRVSLRYETYHPDIWGNM